MPRRQKFTSDEAALLAACLATPADWAPWLVFADLVEDRHGPEVARSFRDQIGALVLLPQLPHLWRCVANRVRLRPDWDRLRAELAAAFPAAVRLATQRLIPERCECGRPLQVEWRPCDTCGPRPTHGWADSGAGRPGD